MIYYILAAAAAAGGYLYYSRIRPYNEARPSKAAQPHFQAYKGAEVFAGEGARAFAQADVEQGGQGVEWTAWEQPFAEWGAEPETRQAGTGVDAAYQGSAAQRVQSYYSAALLPDGAAQRTGLDAEPTVSGSGAVVGADEYVG